MKARLLGVVTLLVLAPAGLYASDGLGIGIIAGEPAGVTLKNWVGEKAAVDAAAAWSFSENESFQFHVDYLRHNFDLLQLGEHEGRLPVYYGLGGRLKLKSNNNGNARNDDDSLVGVRVPLGISYLFAAAPVDLFAEVVPILDVAPDTEFAINGALGARYYF